MWFSGMIYFIIPLNCSANNIDQEKSMKRLSQALKEAYGEKVYRLSLSSGCTCPNRDGNLGYGGCTFCSEGGSGEFAAAPAPLEIQLAEAKNRIRQKTTAEKFIAYFQSFSNTYGDPERLRALYMDAVRREEIAVLALGTRPDCLPDDILLMLKELNEIKPVWIELGLQTIHERTAERIHRGYPLSVFEESFRKLKEAGLTVVVHVIFGLPGETKEDMLATVHYLAGLFAEYAAPRPKEQEQHAAAGQNEPTSFDGVKLQMLQILKGTKMAEEYLQNPFPLFSLEEYTELVKESVRLLPADTVLHRMTGDGPKRLLIAPLWCADKKRTLNYLNRIITL